MIKPKISVIVVKYRSNKYLTDCLDSIKKQKPYEIIVVDNDKENRGYGAGCNVGAKKATGEYLLFLNPDTLLLPSTINIMVDYLQKHKQTAVVGPKLFKDKSKKVQQLSACKFPTPLTALTVYGKFRKLWPNNPIGKLFVYHRLLIANQPMDVDVVSGAAFMIRSSVFKKINGFDEKFFLYFEENDLCRRVKILGYNVFFLPNAEVIHFGGGSTIPGKEIDSIFNTSRNYFFTKHYSKVMANIVNILLK